VWVDRKGLVEPVGAPEVDIVVPKLSPDGTQIAYNNLLGQQHVWLYNITRGSLSKITSDGRPGPPCWTPDGKYLTFFWAQTYQVPSKIYRSPVDRSSAMEVLTAEDVDIHGWSPNQEYFVFRRQGDIWAFRMEDGHVEQFTDTSASERYPAISPDGKWIAYTSDASGQQEVVVEPFPDPGKKETISAGGGRAPLWSRDGSELFYTAGIGPTRKMLAVSITMNPTFSAGMPRFLFDSDQFAWNTYQASYDITPDVKSFVMKQPVPQPQQPATKINIIHGFFEELKRLCPPTN
jgi:serine/threonine-protein kinase